MIKAKAYAFSSILLLSLGLTAEFAHAQTNGMTRYANGILQVYGNGDWNFLDQGSAGQSCGNAGGFRFNVTAGQAEFCNGIEWRSMNSGHTIAGGGSAGMTKYSNGQFMVHNGTAWVVAGGAPLHRWKFEETSGTVVADSQPNPLNGTFSGGANVVSDPVAIDGAGFVFDGSNDFIDVPNTGNIFQTLPLTWTMWVKFDVLPTSVSSNKYFIRMEHLSSPWLSYVFWVHNGTDKMKFSVNSSGGSGPTITTNETMVTNTWYHVAGTIDASFNFKLYVNGVLIDEMNSGSLFAANGVLRIGGNTGTINNLDGSMDDVRFYDRVLTAGEVNALYWQGNPSVEKTIVLTSGSSWTVPNDWNANLNSIEVIGGGAKGIAGSGTCSGRQGGGGGAYSVSRNVSLTPGATVTYAVGAGGTTGSVDGGDTYICNSTSNCASIGGTAVVAGAKGGVQTGGVGGASSGGVATGPGALKYSGGNGGSATDCGGSGGGGAGGPYGTGANGGTTSWDGGSGGGGGGGGTNGSNTSTNNGSNGGFNYQNLGRGLGSSTGDGSDGAVGGGGGGGSDTGVNGGGDGGQGVIVIKYTPSLGGPNHHYKLDETTGTTINDTGSDTAINGTFSGAANVTSDPNAPVTTGLVFDGSNDLIDIANTAEVFETPPFTWSMWFKIDTLASTRGDSHYLLRMVHSASPWASYRLWINSVNDILVFTPANSSGTNFPVDSNSTIGINKWYHVAITLDSTFRAKMYLDGVLQNDSELVGSLYNADGVMRVNCNNPGVSCLDGNMDDIRFYSRTLSANEIKALYDQTKPIQFIQQSGLTTNSDSSPHVTTFSTLPTAGNTVLVYFASWKNLAHDVLNSSITDNHGNTYQRACKRSHNSPDDYVTGIWYAKNIKIGAASSYTVTLTPTTTSEALLRAVEYSGLDPISPLDKSASNQGSGTNTASGTTATTSVARELLAAVLDIDTGINLTLTDPAGWTSRGKATTGINPRAAFADRLVYSTGTYSASWTIDSSQAYSSCIATFAGTAMANACPGGYESGGYCYYDGPLSTSCDNVCAGYGKACNLAGTQAASVDNATCTGILTGLGRAPQAVTASTYTYGCSIAQSSNAVRRHSTSTSVTCNASNGSYNRVCACD